MTDSIRSGHLSTGKCQNKVADGDAVASANPNVRLVRIAGAGHNPHRDDPEAVRRALLGWLAVQR